MLCVELWMVYVNKYKTALLTRVFLVSKRVRKNQRMDLQDNLNARVNVIETFDQ